MVLHTHQQHPHVHLVVKAESEDGRRLHIDKDMLRHWREDFARLMGEQGIAANATPRFVRGRNKGKAPDPIFRARKRGASTVARQRVTDVASQLTRTGSFSDPARAQPVQAAADIERALAWREGSIVLEGETLAEAAAQFNRYNAHKLIITDPQLAGEKLVGSFKATEPMTFARAVATTLGAHVAENDDSIQLSRDAH
jgi:hypothetical protein